MHLRSIPPVLGPSLLCSHSPPWRAGTAGSAGRRTTSARAGVSWRSSFRSIFSGLPLGGHVSLTLPPNSTNCNKIRRISPNFFAYLPDRLPSATCQAPDAVGPVPSCHSRNVPFSTKTGEYPAETQNFRLKIPGRRGKIRVQRVFSGRDPAGISCRKAAFSLPRS